MERSPLVEIVTLRSGELVSPGIDHLIVRRNLAGHYGLFGILDNDLDEFAVTDDSYVSEARAVDAAQSFAASMHVGRIYVVRGN